MMQNENDTTTPDPIQAAIAQTAGSLCHHKPCRAKPDEMVCDECDAINRAHNQRVAERERLRSMEKRTGWFLEKIPDTYHDTERDRLTDAARQILRTWDPEGRHGVTICGPTRTQKTRLAVELLREAHQTGLRVAFRQAGEFRREVNQLAREGRDSDALRAFQKIDVLLIDDFGNQARTESSDEFFLALLERMTGGSRKTIVTSQWTSAALIERAEQHGGGRAMQAMSRRIATEFAWVFRTDDQTIHAPQRPRQ